jgi:hypothetical protein
MKRREILSFSLLIVFITQMIIIPGIQFTAQNNGSQLNSEDDEADNNLMDDLTPESSASGDAWWDETFMYRIPLTITEPGVMTRVNESVSIALTFETNTHRWNSTRLVSNKTGTWQTVSFQLSEVINQSGNVFINSFTIHFLVTVLKSYTAHFYVYYSEDVTTPYSQKTLLSATVSENLVSIDNGYYQLELTKGQAYTKFQFKSSTNLHTKDSLMPTRIASSNYTKEYTPDVNGYIKNWLLCGYFNENPSWNLHESGPSIKRFQLDIKRDWAAGEYASGGTAQLPYTNPNIKWTVHQDTDYYIDLNWLYSNPRSSSGNPEDCVAYAMCYVNAEYDLNNIYLKVGSDDAIAVVMDNDPDAPTWEDYVLRAAGIDQSVWGPFNMTKGWHSFLVYVNERGGNWGFSFRFSTDAIPGSTNVIVSPLKISLVPPTKIKTISQVEYGPIYNKYQVEWTDTADVKIWDTITVYSGATNAWKCERTFWWGKIRTSPTNSSFGILNTLFKNPDAPANYDYYLGPPLGDDIAITATPFSSTNYTLIYDTTSPKKALGIYISDIETGPGMTLSDIDWVSYYDSTNPLNKLIDMIPGLTTDLNKPLYFSSYNSANAKYNATVTFWEYLNKTIDTAVMNDTYLALKSPLSAVNGSIKHLYYELDIHFVDHDGLNAKNVNITLINATDFTEWNFIDPAPQSKLTDNDGNVHFIRIKESNYTVNVTYENYGHIPIFLTAFNVTVNKSQSITAPALSLTTLAINLQKYEFPVPALPQAIVNANVSFYEGNDINPSDYIGSIFSDAFGFVSFVWVNKSWTDMNYSFKVEFLGDRRDINETVGAKEYITVILESFISLTVSVHVQDFTTFLILETGDTMVSNYCGDNLLINVSYWYSLGSINYHIGAATITYTLRRSTIVIDSGTFTPSGPIGYYSHYIDTEALGMLAGQSYTLSISAERSGYTRADNTTFISLLYLPMELTPDTSLIEINWLENLTFGIRLEDTNSFDWISDATVTYEIAQIPSIHGNLIRDISRGLGWYNLSLNSTEFPNYGSYTLSVRATKTNYAPATEPISIVIRQIRTLINGTIFLPKQFEIFVGTVQFYRFNYTDSDGRGISNADLPSWELQRLNDEGLVMWGISGNLIETAQIGIYQIDGLDTSLLQVGRYSIVVRISVTNYVERQSALSLTIKQITIQMVHDITGDIYTSPKGTNINISITIIDPISTLRLGNALVNITYRGVMYEMDKVGTSGVYFYIIDTNLFDVLAAADTFGAVITIFVNENYTINPISVTVSIQPPLGPLGIPLIYWIIGSVVGGVAIGAFVTAKGIQYARIPMMVKDVQAAMKVIKKNGKFSNTKVARSPDEILEQDSEAEYASLGLSLKGKLSPQTSPRSLDDVNQLERRSE